MLGVKAIESRGSRGPCTISRKVELKKPGQRGQREGAPEKTMEDDTSEEGGKWAKNRGRGASIVSIFARTSCSLLEKNLKKKRPKNKPAETGERRLLVKVLQGPKAAKTSEDKGSERPGGPGDKRTRGKTWTTAGRPGEKKNWVKGYPEKNTTEGGLEK